MGFEDTVPETIVNTTTVNGVDINDPSQIDQDPKDSVIESKKSRTLYNPDDPPYITSTLDLQNPIQEQTRHRLRLMVFPKTKIPYVDLPHGMKNILYRSHRRNVDDDGNVIDSKGLSEKWHVNTTTMLNTEVYEQWKRNWLNEKLDDLKEDVKEKKKP